MCKHALALALASLLPFAALSGCPAEHGNPAGTAGSGNAGGGAGDAGDAGDAGEPWDPVWHETKPKTWQTVDATGNPDCGPGCRMALNVHAAALEEHSQTTERVGVPGQLGIAFGPIEAGNTSIIPHEAQNDVRLQVALWGDYISALRSFGIGHGQVEVVSLITGETKIAFKYTPPGTSAVSETALNAKYVFWERTGRIWARDLQTGAVKQVSPFDCYSLCASEDVVFCDGGKIYLIDPETSTQTFVDNGGELQTDGACSPDRKQYAWIDYRDPPGKGASKYFARSGGEVYVHDLATAKTRRVTFDSPTNPMGKTTPAVSGDTVVWSQPLGGEPRNPSQAQELYAVTKELASLDLKTGERCRLLSPTPGLLGTKAVYGRKILATWLDKKENQARVILLDLDDPGLQWACEPTPGWQN